jgi:hypothetical protein
LDKYDNLILLCRVDHKIVDDQPREFTADTLRKLKKDHERWAAERFKSATSEDQIPPTRIVPHPGEPKARKLTLLASGEDGWRIVSHSHAYRFMSVPESDATPEQCDASDGFLDLMRDWGDISDDIEGNGMSAVREAKRSVDAALVELTRRGLVAFGGRRRLRVEGGIGPPSDWWEATIAVRRADDPAIRQIDSSSPTGTTE